MSPVSPSLQANAILSALPAADYERLAPHLKPRLFHLGQPIYHMQGPVEHVYFLKSGIISSVVTSATGVSIEVGLIGREGVCCAGEVLSNSPCDCDVNVQVAGSGWQMSAAAFKEQWQQSATLQQLQLRQQQLTVTQLAQSVLCNRFHLVEQRLCRWLLQVHDRVHVPEIDLTHEFIACMLGTRRVGVTEIAGALRKEGLIEYQRGVLTILDRAGLENKACECYAVVKERSTRLFPSS